MRTVSIFKNAKNQAVRLPKDMEYQGVNELEIIKNGDEIILRPVRPNWVSFADFDKADDDFMAERQDVVADEGRFDFE
ncbi:type II toxin-antitoxin system VapB family antitoxin [Vibrio diabolicus]|uniref:type II toxin-antitoxin system VapB family antitoxin n=1 Tax=Vibrio TaxID=662 RepID=UPI00084A7DA9|nr:MULTISPECIES: type II toxin-antitoxin system VapB family antitoxin [Vibrio]EGQ7904714.1 AbrB/MazE/SpoVT family DNA-binding domain-containing protein [Vibrio alginolyticus]EGQ9764929.1 AbrB/MazE/SpoVT family DNA-binding domain-containing protein [Vibrio alginolyticus]EJS2610390.1 AbrB/MazE/SpoVT family DNA-binding domain-containing protein [Vibrio alginolyticus]ELA7190180.1 AbrB/MazE/SpoVT family DNA-binding domain-containing protein [Vibrio alginolyticus]MCR9550398.1 type II toxin-antitoxin